MLEEDEEEEEGVSVFWVAMFGVSFMCPHLKTRRVRGQRRRDDTF
jgi:hypothetical protein